MTDAESNRDPNCSKNKAEHCGNTANDNGDLYIEVRKSIVATCFSVYDKLGYGFLERVYAGALEIELRKRGHRINREMRVPVFYEGVQVARYTVDFIVDDSVLLEVKSTETLCAADKRQLINYLRCTNYSVGILFHFGPRPQFHRFSIPTSPHRPHFGS